MESSSEKSVRLPTFDGKEKYFRIWWKRFTGYAGLYKFKQALVVGGENDLPAKGTHVPDTKTDAGKAEARALWRNEVAMANLAMTFTTEGLINMLDSSTSSDWPDGKAHLVVEALFAKYEPKDVMSLVELQDALHSVSMKKEQAPAELFEKLNILGDRLMSCGRLAKRRYVIMEHTLQRHSLKELVVPLRSTSLTIPPNNWFCFFLFLSLIDKYPSSLVKR
jgi:hypothetical protein